MLGMNVRVTLPQPDVQFPDGYAKERGLGSCSAAIREAVRLLRSADLGTAYEGAWQQWTADGESDAWDPTVGDGLPSRPLQIATWRSGSDP